MHRRIAPVFLAVLIAFPLVVPASAAEPAATSSSQPSEAPSPSAEPSPEPTAEKLLSHIATFVRVVPALLQHEPAQFWGDQHKVVRQLVTKELSGVGARVADKFKAAQSRMRLLGPQDVTELAKIVAEAISKADEEELIEWAEQACPVCSSPGRARGEVFDFGDAYVEDDEYEGIFSWTPHIVNLVESFKCEVCLLEIEGADELDAAGLPKLVDNNRVDASLVAEMADWKDVSAFPEWW